MVGLGILELLNAGPIRCSSLHPSDPGGFDARDEAQVAAGASACGFPHPRSARQVHGTLIDLGQGLAECDAFILEPGSCALIRHADCFPVVVADPSSPRAALAHCGWRGTLEGLAGSCVDALVARGSRPEELLAAIGPGIAPESFEVGVDVQELFPARNRSSTSWGSPSVDLPGVLATQLRERGVERIRFPSIDTFRSPRWHSHRRDAAHSGRNATICMVDLV